METAAFVTVVRDRLARGGGDTAPDMLYTELNRVVADRFESRRDQELAHLQFDIAELRRELQEEMQSLRVHIGVELAERSADSMKWAMLFWVGQALAVAGIVSALR